MSIFLFYNNAASTLAGPITNTATTIQLAAGDGAQFTPPPTGGQLFCMTLNDAATGLLREIIHVTNVTGDILTVVRAQEGTTALSWLAGDLIINQWTAGSAEQMLQQGQLPGTIIYVAGADTGTANNIVVATSPVISALAPGNIIEVTKGSLANTGAVTIQENGSSAIAITWSNGSPLAAGDWPAGATGLISYQAGGTFQLISFTSSSSPNLVHYGVAGGTANALTVTFAPQISALTDGLLFEITPSANNTGATTINPNGLGVAALQYDTGAGLVGGELIAGNPVLAMALGGAMRLLTTLKGGLKNVQVFNTSGTYTATPGTSEALIFATAGGGGGGGGYGNGGGGGGGGGTAVSLESTIGLSPQTVTIGGGGAGGAGGSYNNGATGGTTSVGSLAVATGGLGGWNTGTVARGNVGGAATTYNLLNLVGGVGIDSPTGVTETGPGGGTFFGQGGAGYNAITLAAATAGNYGGGGGGGYSGNGGNGGNGLVFIMEF